MMCVCVFQGVGAVSVFKECTRMRPEDPSLPLLAAKICINQLHWVNIHKSPCEYTEKKLFWPTHCFFFSTTEKMMLLSHLEYCCFSKLSFQCTICSTCTHTSCPHSVGDLRRITLLSVLTRVMNSLILRNEFTDPLSWCAKVTYLRLQTASITRKSAPSGAQQQDQSNLYGAFMNNCFFENQMIPVVMDWRKCVFTEVLSK